MKIQISGNDNSHEVVVDVLNFVESKCCVVETRCYFEN